MLSTWTDHAIHQCLSGYDIVKHKPGADRRQYYKANAKEIVKSLINVLGLKFTDDNECYRRSGWYFENPDHWELFINGHALSVWNLGGDAVRNPADPSDAKTMVVFSRY